MTVELPFAPPPVSPALAAWLALPQDDRLARLAAGVVPPQG